MLQTDGFGGFICDQESRSKLQEEFLIRLVASGTYGRYGESSDTNSSVNPARHQRIIGACSVGIVSHHLQVFSVSLQVDLTVVLVVAMDHI